MLDIDNLCADNYSDIKEEIIEDLKRKLESGEIDIDKYMRLLSLV